MPGPSTEILNEDLKELKGYIRDVLELVKGEVHRIDIGVAEIKTDNRRNNFDGLKSDVQHVELGLVELRTEFRLAKWLLGLLLVSVVTGVASGIWWASKLDNRVTNLEVRFDRLESKFDRQEVLMTKVLEQMRSAPTSPPK